ncbi:hypothetical protein Q3G72_030572 [Acer saccharum]|nr:hypothetical protein Q3G72_030572 [Acer saccharum]
MGILRYFDDRFSQDMFVGVIAVNPQETKLLLLGTPRGAFMQLSNTAAKRAPNCLAALQQRSEISAHRCPAAAAAGSASPSLVKTAAAPLPLRQRSRQRLCDKELFEGCFS